MMFFFVCVLKVTLPTRVSGVTARAVAVQSVRLSGNWTLTTAFPSGPVWMAGCQKAVARKSSRISGCARGWPTPP